MNKLKEIVDHKRREVERLHEEYPDGIPGSGIKRASFADALSGGSSLKLIAEVKRRSPSAGDIASGADPVMTAKTYAENGASAVSVLTDAGYFGGSWDFLRGIARVTEVPLLCKDFIVDPLQIDLAAEYGASAVLLIAEVLDDTELLKLLRHAERRGMDVLMEAHAPGNIERAVSSGAKIVGINNRDLTTFELDPEYALRYIGMIPADRIRLALSGVEVPADAEKFARAGFDGILVGTSLMRSADPGGAVKKFITIPLVK
ncbi:MAG: hypothetical protein A2Y33_03070 [Spirochaetes bacterium GWF1_51_8]|nr:MAG: hypothetical protein A2Y33_03070 [Spirochaetes bacterium GWF1_51_8]